MEPPHSKHTGLQISNLSGVFGAHVVGPVKVFTYLKDMRLALDGVAFVHVAHLNVFSCLHC